jgi:monofunctional biosynthetic peptidoglycan transglycosylase
MQQQPRFYASSRRPGFLERARAWLLRHLLLAAVALCAVSGYVAIQAFRACTTVAALRTQWPDTTSFMRYRMKQAEDSGREFHLRWQPVPMEAISPHLKACVLAGEDDRFYLHRGFDFASIRHAVQEAEKKGHFRRGASTLTQQLAKNLFLNPEHSFVRKLREAVYTVLLEHFLTKDRILEIYLNSVEWGDGVFGAQEASRTWFAKDASALSLDEAARLAACLPKPLKVHPNGQNRFVIRRKTAILANLRRYKGIGRAPSRDLIDIDDDETPSDNAALPAAKAASAPAVDSASKPVNATADSGQ